MSTAEKALDVLETILNRNAEVSLAEIAKMTGLNKSTAYRMSNLLVKRGYLNQHKKRGNYTLGPRFFQYWTSSNIFEKLKDNALPYLQALSEEFGESVNMAILEGIKPIGIASVAAERILKVAPSSVGTLPLHCTAMGKILLAYKPNERIENIIKITGLKPYTDHTIIDLSQLMNEINIVRRDGVAFDDEEYTIGVRSIAVPIIGREGKFIAAISLVGPSPRISKPKMMQLAPKVKYYALEISRSLGYNGEKINIQVNL
jgi:DNA-binding IclR family transcriptional regulator